MGRRLQRRALWSTCCAAALLVPGTAGAQRDRNVYRETNRPRPEVPVPTGPTRDQMHYRQAAAGGGARTVSELNAGVVSACGLQAWQIDIRRASRDRPDAIVVQRSPTMSARDNACIAQVIGRSRFYVDR